ncbi:MAG: tripartite tricarboxylate transporter substrate binding protein [Polaromonas sp.]|nr:tripartite tricarboxylate transporter substrate binding protein [Polaromonas sp.]
MMKRRTLLSATAAAASALLLPAAMSQTSAYPGKPIKMIVPYAPGISPDIVARLIGNKLGMALGQPVIIDNKPGAGGMIGAEFAAAAPGDGYNLFFTVKGVMAIAPHLYPNARYNALKDFKAISQILVVPHIITATPNAPYNNLKEMVEYAKKNPEKINYASAGVGSQPHVALEAWAKRMGIKLNHIPYKSNPGPDVMSGVVDIYLEASASAIPSIQSGKIKALAVSGNDRLTSLPNLPTVTEFGANLDPNGVIGNSWHGIFTPASTPDEIVSRLNTEIVKIVNTPEIQARLRFLGLTPTGTNAATLASGAASDFAYWGALIKELGIAVE